MVFFLEAIQGNPQKKMSDVRKSVCHIFKHHNYSVPHAYNRRNCTSRQHTSQWLYAQGYGFLITHSFTYINRTIGLDAVRVVKVAVVLITGKKNIIFYHIWGVKQQAANSSQVLETTAPVDPKNLYLPL